MRATRHYRLPAVEKVRPLFKSPRTTAQHLTVVSARGERGPRNFGTYLAQRTVESCLQPPSAGRATAGGLLAWATTAVLHVQVRA